MTISTTTSRISYNGNGVTLAFAVPFRFLVNADLTVILRSIAGVESTLVLNTNYTLTGAGNDAGGTLTMVVAPATGERLVIRRVVGITQETDYITGDSFPAEAHERALDRLTMIAQQTSESQSRSVTIPVSAVSFNPELPALVPSRYIRTNDAGTGFQLSSLVQPGALEVSVLGEALINDLDTNTMQTTLGGSTVGKAVFTAADEPAARAAIGAVPTSRAITAGGLATGGGNLSANLAIDVPGSSQVQAEGGTDNTTAMTPLRVKQAMRANGSAPMFACRAWVNFNGTGTVAILASGNVTSITDNGVGDYTVNFTTAMPDVNYIGAQSVERSAANAIRFIAPYIQAKTTSVYRVTTTTGADAPVDVTDVYVAIFR